MLTSVVTTNKNRVAYAKTLLLNTNRITDGYEIGTYATGTIVVTSYANLIEGGEFDTLEVAGVTFTFQAGASGAGTAQIQAATSNDACATDIAAQINGYTAAGALSVNRITAAASGAIVTLTADNYGTAANAYTLAYVDADTGAATIGLTVSGATMLGGLASTTKFWYNERKNDRRDKADEYIVSTTYPAFKKALDSSDIQNARTELTTTKRNDEAFVKTLNVNLDDIIKVVYFDATQSLVDIARGAFAVDEYKVTHTRAEILALQNAIYKRGTAGTGVAATEYGDADNHKTILTLTDVTFAVTNANLSKGNLLYTLPEGYAVPSHFILDLKVSGDASTATPEMGIGSKLAADTQVTLGADDNLCEDIYNGTAIGAIKPDGVAVALRAEVEADHFPDQGVAPYDGSAAGMPINLNFAAAWGAADDIYINGTITLWWLLRGDD